MNARALTFPAAGPRQCLRPGICRARHGRRRLRRSGTGQAVRVSAAIMGPPGLPDRVVVPDRKPDRPRRRGLRPAMDAVPLGARAGRGRGMGEPAGLDGPCRCYQRRRRTSPRAFRARRHRAGRRDRRAFRRLDRRLADGGRQPRPPAAHGDRQGLRLRHRDACRRPAGSARRRRLLGEVGEGAGKLLLFAAVLHGRGNDHAAGGEVAVRGTRGSIANGRRSRWRRTRPAGTGSRSPSTQARS